ncbi:MAG: SDR family oxidoreductase [Pseudonocardia sp.]|uniref:SDR family NAD(P)-dependent oxidoreductase n=1 Tax=unclassified Pseudonocardia TaxID=2619320 RepID=UPI00086BB1BB|nr:MULTISPECIES: SDR family oxidoreductase [unclassified Pseudonocardia]MBN9107586.1 SDR family oxidoreductase [Pseudonocardia sp.]ODU22985.1 MAG: short-chain dehydrogenase [Pseudonocardia sp. SCN 72-51]ODV08437.1 MAG: short-chain dehydrogenase [Pseudonocardia sp. SCN 73-27]
MKQVAGTSVLVTGGGSGIGEGVARLFAARGARVTISGRREDKIRKVADDIGEACAVVAGDVTVPADRERMLAAAIEHGGGLDTLVNAAGNMYRGKIDELDERQMLDLYHANVVGPVQLTGLAMPALRERSGSVVVFGSVHTQRAFPGASPYAATKGALEALTGVLAAELGPQGVRINCIRPGGVYTEINERAGLGTPEQAQERLKGLASAHAIGRIGTTEEVAEAVVYLAEAEWATGSILTIDGGLSLGVTND